MFHFAHLTAAAVSVAVALLLAACTGGEAVLGAGEGAGSPEAAAFDPFSRDLGTTETVTKRKVIAEPTLADLAEAGPLGDRFMGRADAPVTVIEYGSTTCPYCRAYHDQTWPEIKRQYIDTGKVRYVLREFPIGRSSGTAWIIARCAPEKDFFPLYRRYLKDQPSWVSQEVREDKIFEVAQKAGMTRAQFDACLENKEIESGLKWVKERGRELGVIGTPSFFIGTQQVRSILTLEQFKTIVDPMLRGGSVAAASQG